MRKLYFAVVLVITALSCKKGTDLIVADFDGYAGKSGTATWTVSRYVIADSNYLKARLPLLAPPTTYPNFVNSLNAARGLEISPFSLRLHSSGEMSVLLKNGQNITVWTKNPDLKWENQGDFMYIYQRSGGVWVNTIVANPDLSNMICRFKRTYFGDNTADKDKYVMEILYTPFTYY